MDKLPMYLIISVATGIGGYVPVLLGKDALGGWSILGSFVGGIVGVYIYYKARQSGYIE